MPKTNDRDRLLDYHILAHAFRDAVAGPGYDAQALTCGTKNTIGLSYQQQLDGIQQRFDAAKYAYEATNEYKYYMMQKDLREIANDHLDADLRSFRLSNRG